MRWPDLASKLATQFVHKPWGVRRLPPAFVRHGTEPVGEIWFTPIEQMNQILVKYIFTSEPLSVQVHPDEHYGRIAGLGHGGKDECWLITDARPGAKVAVGFRQPVDQERIRAAALDGTLEELLAWFPVQRGHFFYIPAGTVHAIGAGISLIEVQQNNDFTYRLYDYGRPRDLHLDDALKVASGAAYDISLSRRISDHRGGALVEGPHFRVEHSAGAPCSDIRARSPGPLLIVPFGGAVFIADERIGVGDCAYAQDLDALDFAEDSLCLIVQPCRSAC